MGKSTISMVIFNSYVSLPEGRSSCWAKKISPRHHHRRARPATGTSLCRAWRWVKLLGFSTTNWSWGLPSGKHTKNYGESPCSMAKSTISMDHLWNYQRLTPTSPPKMDEWFQSPNLSPLSQRRKSSIQLNASVRLSINGTPNSSRNHHLVGFFSQKPPSMWR